MLRKKIPLYYLLLTGVACILVTYFISQRFITNNSENQPSTDKSVLSCNFTLTRLNGYKFVRPLMFADEPCEADKLLPVKNEVQKLINAFKLDNTISTASVYLRELNQGEWISIDENEKYFPGSLLKVPELITFMKMNEKSPGLLDKKIAYNQPISTDKTAHYISKTIKPGNSYTVRELLYYMIAYSDNNATLVLNSMLDWNIFKKIFTDIGLAEPDLTAKDVPLTVKEYSLFMRVLYNASYISSEDSEFCTELLSHSDFATGLVNGLPVDTKVAHKFGEAGDNVFSHFSESGIVYINNSPYLLTVMTKGKNLTSLPAVVSNISKKVFQMLGS